MLDWLILDPPPGPFIYAGEQVPGRVQVDYYV